MHLLLLYCRGMPLVLPNPDFLVSTDVQVTGNVLNRGVLKFCDCRMTQWSLLTTQGIQLAPSKKLSPIVKSLATSSMRRWESQQHLHEGMSSLGTLPFLPYIYSNLISKCAVLHLSCITSCSDVFSQGRLGNAYVPEYTTCKYAVCHMCQIDSLLCQTFLMKRWSCSTDFFRQRTDIRFPWNALMVNGPPMAMSNLTNLLLDWRICSCRSSHLELSLVGQINQLSFQLSQHLQVGVEGFDLADFSALWARYACRKTASKKKWESSISDRQSGLETFSRAC